MQLLFEIGTEELPAGEVDSARTQLAESVTRRFAAERLSHGAVHTWATPRRLTLFIDDVAAQAETIEETVVGPSAKASWDADGNLTRAAQGFVTGKGLDATKLFKLETPKGEYIAARVVREGRPAADIATEALNAAPPAINWKKSMRWAWSDATFSRPVQWIVALLDVDVLEVEFAGIRAGRSTRGHRFMAPQEFELASPANYLAELRKRYVEADVDARRELIRSGVIAEAAKHGLAALIDEDLVDEVVHLVEWPVPLVGRFDAELLEVPREVLITTMRTHQRYFALESEPNKLANAFCFISNMVVPDPSIVISGNLRVLRARLEDARFFWRQDLATPLVNRVAELERVVNVDKLGSVLARAHRIERLAGSLAAELYGDEQIVSDATSAAHLCKADLVSGMVYQFPELQGTMGRYYAAAQGSSDAVATAIEEHYRPRGATDDPARTPAGACVAIADKLDTIVGSFAIGQIPSGNADPYGLRRAAIGVIRTVIRHGLKLSLHKAISLAYAALPAGMRDQAVVTAEVAEFFAGRLENLLAAEYRADVVSAVVAVASESMHTAPARAAAIELLRSEADFEPLAAAFKRVVNILRKASDESQELAQMIASTPDFSLSLVEAGAERALAEAFAPVRAKVERDVAEGAFANAARAMLSLKPEIDAFFDGVLVNVENVAVRRNRLLLLASIRASFVKVADLSKIQVAA
jgi:glycyl-tRNA synthetase beta chain